MKQDKSKIQELEAVINKFSRFVRAHIYKYNVQNKGIDPDDIFQEVKLKIWKILNDEKKIDNYASYIRKIVDSSVIDQLRKLKREKGIFSYAKQKWISESKIDHLSEIQLNNNLKKIIRDAVDSLIESRRKAVKLFLLNLTIDEISVFLNWSRDKTRNLLYRGLSDLKRKLQEKGIEYENKK